VSSCTYFFYLRRFRKRAVETLARCPLAAKLAAFGPRSQDIPDLPKEGLG
jgi:hypothetical protein